VRRIAAAAVIALAATAAACSKPQQPKVEPLKTEMKALDTAKGLEADINRKAQDNLEAVDKISK
jgi:hypothetical protein